MTAPHVNAVASDYSILLFAPDGNSYCREVQGCHGYFSADWVGIGMGHRCLGEELDSYAGFMARFRGIFDHPLEGRAG